MRILLMGNPNVGKSVVFNRLTGANVITANYPGTTVGLTRGRTRVGGESVEVIDVPGTYSLSPTSRAEEVAVEFVRSASDDDIIINVVDSTNLERNLGLTLELLRSRKRMVVALNFWDEARHTGVRISIKRLSGILGVPCAPLVAITGVGIRRLVERLPRAKVSNYVYEDKERWSEVGRIVEQVQRLKHRHHSMGDRLRDISVQPLSGTVLALLVLAAVFESIRWVGEGLISWVLDPLYQAVWAPVTTQLSDALGGRGILHGLLIGNLIDGKIVPMESFGLLTTGIHVPLVEVMPYLFAFYLALSFLEDCGYLPRIAILADIVMHRIGLHGMGIIPMILGMGCNVPGVLASRIMESRRERFIAIALMAMTMPCMPQRAMIMGLAGAWGMKALLPIFGTLFVVWIVAGRILNRCLPGESPEILVDIPPYRIPYWRGLWKKVGMRMVWFLREAVPWVFGGVLLVNLLYSLGIVRWIGWVATPIVSGVFGLPPEAAGGLVLGFLRKDVAVGMLAPFHLGLRQTVVACVVMAMYFPCVATFVMIVRELGIIDTLKVVGLMLTSSLVVGGLLNLGFRIAGL